MACPLLAFYVTPDEARQILRRTHVLPPEEIIGNVASNHKVEAEDYVGFRSSAAGRAMAALLCRSLTNATLAELSIAFGLHYKDSSANLVRRAKRMKQESRSFNNRLAKLEKELLWNQYRSARMQLVCFYVRGPIQRKINNPVTDLLESRI